MMLMMLMMMMVVDVWAAVDVKPGLNRGEGRSYCPTSTTVVKMNMMMMEDEEEAEDEEEEEDVEGDDNEQSVEEHNMLSIWSTAENLAIYHFVARLLLLTG